MKRKADTDVIRSDMRGMGEGLRAYPEDLKSTLVARRKVKEDSDNLYNNVTDTK